MQGTLAKGVTMAKFKRSSAAGLNLKLRMEVISRLEDQDILMKIAFTDPDDDVRKAAVLRLKNKKYLLKVAKKTRDDEVRETAAQRLQILCLGDQQR